MSEITAPVITVRKVSKSFGPVKVVSDVSFDLYAGKVLVLLGENGAGKSTIIKMIAGVHEPDSGEIIVDGTPVRIPNTRVAESLGIATIHQELNLVPSLSVAENVMLGRTPKRFGLVNRKVLREQAREALQRIGLTIDPSILVSELGIAQQQLVEIAKALSVNARVLILDEPTAALTRHETRQLFRVVEELRAHGVAMLFISHHLEEIAEIGDTVVVLRDGEQIAEVPGATPEDELVRLMVGRDIAEQFPRRRPEGTDAPALLEVTALTAEGRFSDVNLSVRAGEIVGIAGLVGAGRTELLRAIAGVDRYDSGSVTVAGKRLPPGRIDAAIRAKVGHVPEDRKRQGLVMQATVNENLGFATLASSSRAGLVDFAGQRKRATVVVEKLRVRMNDIDQAVGSLSGGNQQKVVFGRWIMAGSQVLLLDEPTRGVDVGAKVEIYELMNTITAAGGAVLMVSSELPEVMGMSDRILVMRGGRIRGQFQSDEATEDKIMDLAARGGDE